MGISPLFGGGGIVSIPCRCLPATMVGLFRFKDIKGSAIRWVL